MAKIDPQTGLIEGTGDPKKESTGNAAQDSLNAKASVSTTDLHGDYAGGVQDLSYKLAPGESLSRYKKYGVTNLLPGGDWDEERARRQSTGQKWINGLAKAGVTTLGAIAENSIGAIDGIGESIYHKDATKLYDNAVGRTVDKTNEWMQYNFPNFATRAEQNARGLESLGYANFWADKVANGLGYSLGSVATVYLTGGMGVIGRGANLLGKAGKVSRAGKILNAAKAVDTAADVTSAVGKGASMGQKAMSAVRASEIGMMMSFGESSVEARETLNTVTEQLKIDRAAELGIEPEQLSPQDLAGIKDEAASVANMAFVSNLAVTGTTNFITFGKTLMPKYFDMKPKASFITRNAKGEYIDALAKMNPVKRALTRYGLPTLQGALSETAQEGLQFTIAQGAEAKATDDTIGNWADAFYHGMQETYGTKEGQESMLIGGIVGLLTGGFGSVRTLLNADQDTASRAKTIQMLNNPNIMTAIRSAHEAGASVANLKTAAAALEAGDHKQYRDAVGQAQFHEVLAHVERGSLDMYLQKLDDVSKMDDAEVRQAFGIPEGVKFDKKAAVAGLKQSAREIVEMKDKIDAQFPTPRQASGIDRLRKSKEQLTEEQRVAEDTIYLKDLLLQSTYGLNDADSRIEKLVNEVNQLDPKASLTADEFRASEALEGPLVEIESVNEEGRVTKSTIGKLNAETKGKLDASDKRLLETDPSKHAEAKDKLKDLERLTEDRARAVEALQQLYADPEVRKMYMDRTAQKEVVAAQKRKDTSFKQEANRAHSVKQLNDMLDKADEQGISRQAQDEVASKRAQMIAKISDLYKELDATDLDEIQKRADAETDPFMKEVLGGYLLAVQEGKHERESFKGKETADDPITEEEQANEDIEDIRNNENAAPEFTTGSKQGVTMAPGQFATITVEEEGESKVKVELDYAGRPSVGSDARDKKYEQQLAEGRKLQSQNLKDRDVTFRILEDHTFTEFNKGKDSEAKNSAIGVYLDGALLGLINPNTTDRGVLYNRLVKDGEVAGKVVEQQFGNVNNVIDADTEQKVFTPINEVVSMEDIQSGNVAVAVLRFRKQDGQITKYWDLGLDEHPLTEAAAQITSRGDVMSKYSLGEIALLTKKPTGEVSALKLSTEKLSPDGLAKAESLLKEGNIEGVKSIVGIPSMLHPAAKLFISEDNADIYYQVPDGQGLFASISVQDYQAGDLNNVKIGKLVQDSESLEYKLQPESEAALRSHFPAGVISPIRTKVLEDISIQLTESRFQVDALKINGLQEIQSPLTDTFYDAEEGRGGHLDYLSSSEETGIKKPILSADFKNFDKDAGTGGLYHDVRFVFSYATEEGGKQSEKTGVPVAEPAGPTFTAQDLSAEETTEEPALSAESLSVEDELTDELREAAGRITSKEAWERRTTAAPAKAEGRKSKFNQRRESGKKKKKVDLGKEILEEVKQGTAEEVPTEALPVEEVTDEYTKKKQAIDKIADETVPQTVTVRGKNYSLVYKDEMKLEGIIDLETNQPVPFDAEAVYNEPRDKYFAPTLKSNLRTDIVNQFLDDRTAKIKEIVPGNFIEGDPDYRKFFRLSPRADVKIDPVKAKSYLTKLFGKDAVVIFDQLQKVGNDVVHGYMKNAAVYLYSGAAVGTEYHEGFHMFFRNFLTDAQRASMYEEAAERYGEPSAQEIAAARRGQPVMEDAEARLLALEERMAEEMREYALDQQKPQGIGRRLFKFFKDLFAYIKAVATNRVGIDQAFRMLETGRIPATLSRKADRFSPSPAFLLEQFSDRPAHRNELTDVAIWKLINDLDKIPASDRTKEATSALGTADGKKDSAIRNWFLRHAFNVSGQALNDEQFAELKEAFDTENDERIDEIAQFGSPRLQVDGTPMPAQMLALDANDVNTAADDFLEVYEGWFDERSEVKDGVYNKSRGFRSETIERLKMYGYTVTDTEAKENTDNLKLEEEDVEERVYSKSRLEESPAKKISDRAKRLLSRIPIQPKKREESLYGFQTFVPLQDAMRVIAATVDGASTLSEMMKRFDQRTDNYNILKNAKAFIEQLPVEGKAVFFANFALSTNNFLMPKTTTDAQGNVVVQFITPNANAARKFWQTEWKKQQTELPGGLYQTTRDRSGNVMTRLVDPVRKASIQRNYDVILDDRSSEPQKQKALAEILIDMGIGIADTKAEAVDRMQSSETGVFTMMRKDTNLEAMIKSVLSEAPENQIKRNVFDEADSALLYFAREFREKYDGPIATSFVMNDKTYYPLNLRSLLNMTQGLIQSGELGSLMTNKFGHESGKKHKITSPLTKLLRFGRFQQDFEVRDVRVAKTKTNDDNLTLDYENLTYSESLAIRMNLYGNKNKNLGLIAVDTQADRGRLTFTTMPKITSKAAREAYNLVRTDGIGGFIHNQIKLDLYRMADALEVIDTKDEARMIEGYHYKTEIDQNTGEKVRNYDKGGWAKFNVPNVDLTIDTRSELPVVLKAYMDSGAPLSDENIAMIDQATSKSMEYMENSHVEHIEQLGGYENAVAWVRKNIDHTLYAKGLEIQFLKQFSQDDIVGRMMIRQMFRGGTNYTKGGADYIKRAALITTPGTTLILQGDGALVDEDYGMLRKFNEATIADIYTSLPQEQLTNLENAIGNALGNPAAAAKIIDAYRNNNTTDAQAFISPEMYRRIQMGKGLWGTEQVLAWENFKTTGKWNYKAMPVKPMKPFYGYFAPLDGHLVPIADKNSYMVLTPDFIKGNTQLERMYERMNQADNPIHVFNVESAKKLGRRPPFDVTQDLSEIPVTSLDSRGLLFPQEMPDKPEDKTNLGRQPRKNMVANLSGNYTMADGTPLSAEKLKQWYHSAVVNKMMRNKAKVLDQFGAPDEMLESMNLNERKEVMNRVLPQVRDRVMEMAREKGFTENQMKMMDLTVRDGMIVPVLPFAFPTMDNKFGTLVLSIFRKEVYRQKMKGFEAVQFSDFTTEEDEGLKFVDLPAGENMIRHAQVKVKTDTLKKLGIRPNQSLEDINAQLRQILGYRIPQQGKSSMLAMEIVEILPEGYSSSIAVPAGITTQMGSDFDIDKMFLLFPEIQEGQKIQPDYTQDPTTTEEMSEAELNNIIFDTFQAVIQAPQHAAEVLSPLEIPDLEAARPGEKEDIDIYSSGTPIKTGMANMLSNALRGQHANAIAARNVLESAGAVLPLRLADKSFTVRVEGQDFNQIDYVSKFPDVYGVIRPTDYYLSQLLSAAVDSVKDPIQDSMNITSKTANMWHLLTDIGLTPQQIVPFVTHPTVRRVTDAMLKLDENDVQRAANTVGLGGKVNEAKKKRGIDLDAADDLSVLRNLYYLTKLGTRYSTIGRAVTLDNIDASGTVAQHQAKMTQLARLNAPEVEGILNGTDYPIIAAFKTAIGQSLNFMTNLGFASEQSGLRKFKQGILSVVPRANEAVHRDLNRIALHYLATKPGSGIYESGLIDKNVVERVHLDTQNNIAFKLRDMQKRYPGDALLNALVPVLKEGPNGKVIYKVELQNGISRTERQKNDIDSSWYNMLYDTQDQELAQFGRDLVTNTVVSTGFAPGPNSIFDHIPVEFLQEIGISDALHTEVSGRDMASLADFSTEEFLSNYGTHTFGGKHLFPTIADPLTDITDLKGDSPYVIAIDINGSKSLFKTGPEGVYLRMQTKGMQNALYEGNIRGTEGKSLIHSTPVINQSRALDSTSKIKPVGKSVDAQVTKLMGAFKKAGVDVTVEFGTLPTGVKGQIKGSKITIDTEQMTGDTVYHEFAHILIDRLPVDDVLKYAQQISETSPELAMSVKAKYGELSDIDYAKELLVTAVGIEGAKIERNNPSRIQIIINKILRALGKLFGITPNAAAQLAEDLFAGEIRQEIAEGQFNPMVQFSKDVNSRVQETAEDAKVAVEREIKRIERMGKDASKQDLILLKDLRKKLDKIDDIADELDAFMSFQQFATIQTAKARRLYKRLQDFKNRPLTKEEARELLNESNELKYILDGLFNTSNKNSMINKMRRALSDELAEVDADDANRLDRVLRRLDRDIRDLVDIDADYGDSIAPIVADALYEYGDEGTVNTDLDDQINRLRNAMNEGVYDVSGTGYAVGRFNPMRVGEFFNTEPELKKVFRNRQAITEQVGEEGFKKAIVEAKIESLKNKKVGRKQLVEELTKAHRQKSVFSAYFDPLVYSNESNLQLFTNAMRAARTNGNNRTIEMIQDSEEFYKRFVAFKGTEDDVARLNEDILTTVELTKPGGATMNVLSIVQEYDIDDFNKRRNKVAREAAALHKMPDPSDVAAIKQWKYDKRGKPSAAFKAYNAMKAKWELENTREKEGARAEFAKLMQGRDNLAAKLQALELEDAEQMGARGYSTVASDLAVVRAELREVEEEIGKVQVGNRLVGTFAVPNDNYLSDKFKKIQETPELLEYYNYIKDLYFEKQKLVGKERLYTNPWDDYSYVMPSIRKETYDRLKEQGVTATMKDAVVDGVTRQDTDTQFGAVTDHSGERLKSIPIYYTNLVDESEVSRDVISSIIQFGQMAHQFEEKGKIHGLVNAMTNLHERRQTLSEESGIPVIDTIASKVKGVEEYVSQSTQGGDRTYRHLQDFVDKNFYGKYEVTAAMAGGVSGQKLADRAVSLTALNSLAFNFLQIGNQGILDNLMIGQEAGAAEFFNREDRRWALSTYMSEKGAIGDTTAFANKSKLGMAMQMFDAMSDITDELGKNITGSALKKALKGDMAFMFQQGVEHQTTGVKMLSLMHATKGFVDKNGNAIEGNLWDNLIVKDGKLIVNPEIANFSIPAFTAKLAGINRRTNQIKGSFDASAAQSTVIGKLLLLFKNYFVPFYRRRLGHGENYHVDLELGGVTRGFYTTFFGYLSSVMANGGQFQKVYQQLSPVDKRNMRRALLEGAYVTTAMAIHGLLSKMLDDDEDNNYFVAYGAYQARRLQTELLALLNPAETIRMFKAPMATANHMERYWDLTTQLMLEGGHFATFGLIGEEEDLIQQRTSSWAEKGERKVTGKIRKVVPFVNGFKTLDAENVEDRLRFFD